MSQIFRAETWKMARLNMFSSLHISFILKVTDE